MTDKCYLPSERLGVVDLSFAGLTPSFLKPADDSASVSARIGSTAYVTLDACAGAFMCWLRDSADGSEWREIRAGESYPVVGPNLLLAPSAFNPEYRARLLVSSSPLRPTNPAWEAFQTGETTVVVNMGAKVALGTPQGKPSAAGSTVTASDATLRWCVLDGRRGVVNAWVRLGGSGNYFAVEHGVPFPVDGTNFEVLPHPNDIGSVACFQFSHRPKRLVPADSSVFELNLAASAGGLDNNMSFTHSTNTRAVSSVVHWLSAGVGTYAFDYLIDGGSGAVPVVTNLAGGATTGAQQSFGNGTGAVRIASVRFITFGAYVRAWVAR